MSITVVGQALTLERTLAKQLCQWLEVSLDHPLYDAVVAVNIALQRGHSCLLLSDWAGQHWVEEGVYRLALPELSVWHAALSALPIGPNDAFPVVYEHGRVYLRRYWQFESELAGALADRLAAPPLTLSVAVAERLALLFPQTDSHAVDWQRVAAINTLTNPFSVIAGGPGTGKTYTVTRILGCLLAQYEQPPIIKLVAPTGKAAQRLTESIVQAKTALSQQHAVSWIADIPEQASTLHRLLGFLPKQLQFRYHQKNPLRVDCVLIDEASMVDLPLMTRLFRALPDHCRVILLGDAAQLPSVAAGSILADLTPQPHPGYSVKRAAQLGLPAAASTSADYLTFLQHSHRFDGKGGIGVLANSVMSGDGPAAWAHLSQHPEVLDQVSTADFDTQLREWVEQHYRPMLTATDVSAAWQYLSAFRILCATRVGRQGTVALNERITQWLRGQSHQRLRDQSHQWFQGQPIMVTQNDYSLGLFNGDVGLIWPDDDGALVACFPQTEGSFVKVSVARLPSIETVFAMTIHKTQGSEFAQVAMVLPELSGPFLSRELLYTGLTRAKRQFIYCGEQSVWVNAVSRHAARHSGLRIRLGIDQSNTATVANETAVSNGAAKPPEQGSLDF